MHRPIGVWISLLLSQAPAGTPEKTLPACLPGWRIEVVLQAPAIRHPSVACCSPDGRIFVAEDPMDISLPSADAAEGRVVCIHPDGRLTVFAEGLYAVFGMQHLEGKLYVLHNPKFSVFIDDDGIGKNRLDLIESTNPDPWALNWNDHVPANFRLAMDGYIYIAAGDKGVYGAAGQDGKRVDMRSGGILRMRPDGTGLEVYCTGVRNILDAALDAEDEIFTYDNTDEQQWMSRLTHMVDGGFYGYPHDFIPRRPYTLWTMADYGGGAAAGAICYLEDALPEEFRGNLFLADFGKRQILRVRVEREGGSFRAAAREDLFIDPPKDFRPVGITLSPDGASLYICDWNHADTKEKVTVGRLLKLSWTGRSQAREKPSWYLPAALGRPVDATAGELLEGLKHPAHSVRMAAQRRLAERGSGAAEPLLTLFQSREAPDQARMHALWALDAIDGGKAVQPAILSALQDPSPKVRRQAIRQVGMRRVAEAAPGLIGLLRDSEASIRFQAATALGRIGSLAAVPALLAALDEQDLFARFAAFTALNRVGRAEPAAWKAIVPGLGSSNAAIREGAVFAAREICSETLVASLAGFARDPSQPVVGRAAGLSLLAGLHRQRPPWKGEWWAYHPANQLPPAKTEEWAGTAAVLEALRESLNDPRPALRRAGVEGLLEAGDRSALGRLRELFLTESDEQVKRSILMALGALPDRASAALVAGAVNKPDQPQELLAAALAASGQIGGEENAAALIQFLNSGPRESSLLTAALGALGKTGGEKVLPALEPFARHPRAEVRQAALQSIVRMGGEPAAAAILNLLESGEAEVRREALQAVGGLKSEAALPRLLVAARDPETQAEAIAALAQTPDLRALEAYLAGLASRDAMLRAGCRKALEALREIALPLLEEKAGQIAPAALAQIQNLYAQDPRARAGRLFAIQADMPGPETYLDFAMTHGGESSRGKSIFSDLKGAACIRCHALDGQGNAIGPDLATIGAQLTRREIAESVLFPSKAVREGYQQVVILTRKGEIFTGLLKSEAGDEILLQDVEGKLIAIPKAKFLSRDSSAVSAMPEGLHSVLSLEAFADLVEFLASRRGPDPPASDAVEVRWGRLTAKLVNNQAAAPVHLAGYNGLAELRWGDGPSPFVPAYAGLNLEHVNNGKIYRDRGLQFEPRRHPMALRRLGDRIFELHQDALPNTGLESSVRFHFREPHYIDVSFECVPRQERFPFDHLNIFWASYIQKPEDMSIYFLGRKKGGSGEEWIRGVTPGHGVLSTHRGAADRRAIRHEEPFPLTLVFNESECEYTRPFYYGRCRENVWAVFFRARDLVRFTQSPSGGGEGNPAWDFQWFIDKPEKDRRYSLEFRALFKPWAGREDLIQEHEIFCREKEPDH